MFIKYIHKFTHKFKHEFKHEFINILSKRYFNSQNNLNKSFYLKYLKYPAVEIDTLYIGENKRNIILEDVSDLISAAVSKPTGSLLGLPKDVGPLSLHSFEGEALKPGVSLAEITTGQSYDTPLVLKSLNEEISAKSLNSKLFKENLKRENIKRMLENESIEIKKSRISTSQTLVSSTGCDFQFSDRNMTFELLASCLEKRFYCNKVKLRDKMFHQLPILADGPGSGKSRFLQELPNSFANYIKNLKKSFYDNSLPEKVDTFLKNTPTAFEDFKDNLSDALYINISFGNCSLYRSKEIPLEIEVSICLRILYPYFEQKYSSFFSFIDAYFNKHISLPDLTLANIFDIINKKKQCIVLGIDEVNFLHNISKERFKELFSLVGSFSASNAMFFVPVLAGTVIGPMKSIVTDSMYPPLHLPLPLLSFESCLKIFKNKDQKYAGELNPSLKQIIANIGGHCRALEVLFDSLQKTNKSLPNYWNNVMNHVITVILNLYPMAKLSPLGTAIAYSFLSLPVNENMMVSENQSFLNLEEYGILKLNRLSNNKVIVQVPFIFTICFIQYSFNNEYSKFWDHHLTTNKMYWQSWEIFNSNYIAFRLSLFAKLGMTCIPLSQFLAGAKTNIPIEIMIKIPPIEDIKTAKSASQYPSNNHTEYPIGTCVLNAPGASFDAFVYLNTSAGKLLIALQMKHSSLDSVTPQKITNGIIDAEYKKVNDKITKYIPNTDFILVVLGCCEDVYDVEMLPSNTAVVCRNEFQEFYGEQLSQQLNNKEYEL